MFTTAFCFAKFLDDIYFLYSLDIISIHNQQSKTKNALLYDNKEDEKITKYEC
jgi:hypothetical protein